MLWFAGLIIFVDNGGWGWLDDDLIMFWWQCDDDLMYFGHRFGKTLRLMLSEFGITYFNSSDRIEMTTCYEAIQMEMQSGQISGKTLVSGTFIYFFSSKQPLPPSHETTLPQKNIEKTGTTLTDIDLTQFRFYQKFETHLSQGKLCLCHLAVKSQAWR